MTDYAANLAAVRQRIESACDRCQRDPDDVTLVAVSKGHDTAAIGALIELGVSDFGESYVQEWREKADQLEAQIEARWHFIGHLQSNKARFLTDEVALIHSVDRSSVMKALSRRADQPARVLLQINIGEDPDKFGADPDAVIETLQRALSYEKLRVHGLMTIPPFTNNPEDARPHFRALKSAFDGCREWLAEHATDALEDFTELSMGMSADYDVAIEEGATIIRVGTALFGPRSYA